MVFRARARQKVAFSFLRKAGNRPDKGAREIAKVSARHRVCIPAPGPPDLRFRDAVELSEPGALLPPAVGLLFRVNPGLLEHFSVPFELRGVA